MIKGSDDYKQLWSLFLKAMSENDLRLLDLLDGRPVTRRQFRNLDALSILPPSARKSKTLGDILEEFAEYQRVSRANTTPSAYRLPVRILKEFVGESTPLSSITKEHLSKVFKSLKQMPLNLTQRYPKFTMERAIEAVRSDAGSSLISPRTMLNYYMLIVAIFNYAKSEGYI